LELEAHKAGALEAECEKLKKEKEDVAARLSETEIEVLELRETVETATDEHKKALAKLQALEKELEAAVGSSAALQEAIKTKGEEHEGILGKLKEVEEQLSGALESQGEAQRRLAEKEEEHAVMLAEVQRMHDEASRSAREELETVMADLAVCHWVWKWVSVMG